VTPAREIVELHIVSDSTGETAVRLVHALEAQFPDQEFEEIRHPRVETVDDLHLALNRAKGRPAVIVYTLVHPQLRVDERVDDHRRAPLRTVEREMQVVHRLDARVSDLLELLVRELGLERVHEPDRRLAGGVRDDVQLDGRTVHAQGGYRRGPWPQRLALPTIKGRSTLGAFGTSPCLTVSTPNSDPSSAASVSRFG